MVVALIALFVSLSGVAWAAVTLKPNSITSKYLKDGKAVKNQDVVNDTLQGDKIQESTLAQVPSAIKADSAASAATAGSATTAGDAQLLDRLDSADFLRAKATALNADRLDGLDSASFLSSTITVRESGSEEVANNAISGASAQCKPGERAIGGGSGWSTTPGANTMVTLESAPLSGLSGWTVTVGNTSGSSQTYHVVAICVAG
ncbi:MAG TPA: hypothetical protein VFT10_07870 [Solirubrobacterales bacterium]|nr:hypothetical protein [Solirubrobacterales bacterium]